VPHGIACYVPKSVSSSHGLATALGRDVGSSAVGVPVSAKTGWMTASWLVGQAAQYDIDTVSFAGQTWTRSSGRWRSRSTGPGVTYTLVRPGHT
jgi:hypothetical protein